MNLKRFACAMSLAVVWATGAMLMAQTTKPSTQPAKPVNQFCPIETSHAIDAKVTTEHNGKVIGFCCADCIPTFKKDPEKYMKDMK